MALLDRATQRSRVGATTKRDDRLGGAPRRVLRANFLIRVQGTRGRAMTSVGKCLRNSARLFPTKFERKICWPVDIFGRAKYDFPNQLYLALTII
jgi:hypothetical protein